MRPLSGLLLSFFLPALLCAGEDAEFAKRFEASKAALFGGSVKLEAGDKVVITFTEAGQFEKAFEGVGMVNPTSLKGEGNRLIIMKPEGGELPGVAIVGRGNGSWQSRFELSGDVEIKFSLRLSGVPGGAAFTVSLNQSKKAAIQTSFFQTAALLAGGKPKKKVQAHKEYLGPPEKWLDRKFIHTFTLSTKDGKYAVKMRRELPDPKDIKDVDLLSLDDLGDATAGKIAFGFQKLTFALSSMTISGKIDREWCAAQFDDLEAKAVAAALKKEKTGAEKGKGKDAKKEKEEKKDTPPPPPLAPRPKKDLSDPEEKKKDSEEDL